MSKALYQPDISDFKIEVADPLIDILHIFAFNILKFINPGVILAQNQWDFELAAVHDWIGAPCHDTVTGR